jgi:hypothetical protein
MSSSASSGRPSPQPFTLDRVADRRAETRLSAEVLGLDVDARLTVGVHVRVVNVSRGGALLEQGEWLRPGTRTELRLSHQVTGADHPQQLAASGTVARCWVHRLSPLRYRTALIFAAARALSGPQEAPVAVRTSAPRERRG